MMSNLKGGKSQLVSNIAGQSDETMMAKSYKHITTVDIGSGTKEIVKLTRVPYDWKNETGEGYKVKQGEKSYLWFKMNTDGGYKETEGGDMWRDQDGGAGLLKLSESDVRQALYDHLIKTLHQTIKAEANGKSTQWIKAKL